MMLLSALLLKYIDPTESDPIARHRFAYLMFLGDK